LPFRPVLFLCLAFLVAGCQSAETPSSSLAYAAEQTEEDPRYAGLVIDAETGEVLYADNADRVRHPASLTKMMTLYLLFEALESGRVSEGTALRVSRNASRQPASKLGLKTGGSIYVRDAVLALAVRSANDVAVVVAEHLAGSEDAFVRQMNAKARALGMRSTTFRNPHGLPDNTQVTTARDMAVLARALQTHFPGRYRVFSTKSFTFQGQRYSSTNHLLGEIDGLDGIKTGYIRASGYNLAASVRRGGRRLIVIVMGGPSGRARDAQVAALIDEYLPSRGGSLLSFR
jgi:D-alanyl-D-alanine carboxypeptidase